MYSIRVWFSSLEYTDKTKDECFSQDEALQKKNTHGGQKKKYSQ